MQARALRQTVPSLMAYGKHPDISSGLACGIYSYFYWNNLNLKNQSQICG
jgi:hypothetical protein